MDILLKHGLIKDTDGYVDPDDLFIDGQEKSLEDLEGLDLSARPLELRAACINRITNKASAWTTLEPEERAATLAVLAAPERSAAMSQMGFEDQALTTAVQDVVLKFVRMAPEIQSQQLELLDPEANNLSTTQPETNA